MSNPQFAFCNAGTPSLVPSGGQTMAQADTTQAETIRQAARLLLSARYVMTLTGAGISVESGIPKSDTVSFAEPIPPDALEKCFSETQLCDCMIVAGTSATVYPAASFPLAVRDKGGTLIEVNLYESEITPLCTVSLRGPSGQ